MAKDREIKEVNINGTFCLFDHFDIAHLGEGEGKSKFGQGIYITSSYSTAALYTAKANKDDEYFYTLLGDDLHWITFWTIK